MMSFPGEATLFYSIFLEASITHIFCRFSLPKIAVCLIKADITAQKSLHDGLVPACCCSPWPVPMVSWQKCDSPDKAHFQWLAHTFLSPSSYWLVTLQPPNCTHTMQICPWTLFSVKHYDSSSHGISVKMLKRKKPKNCDSNICTVLFKIRCLNWNVIKILILAIHNYLNIKSYHIITNNWCNKASREEEIY